MDIDYQITPEDLTNPLERLWQLSGEKVLSIDSTSSEGSGTPVLTVQGQYQSQGWTEWTQGFQFGWSILQFDATDDEQFLEIGRRHTLDQMASHVTHTGVHDHGFNNVSTYGNLRRLMLEGRITNDEWERHTYELALKCSGAVQASRWTTIHDGSGFIHSFNGPHSLFSDTIRSLRVLAIADRLGHHLMGENDQRISLLDRLLQHARNTAKYNVYFGENRDAYDVAGRVVHESIFNCTDGQYRCPSTQQGYSPFSTWTRGLAWIMLGYAEQLEFLATVDDDDIEPFIDPTEIRQLLLRVAQVTCDFFIENTPTDGIPYWDTGAPGLRDLGDFLDRPAEPYNKYEPVDSSAAAIAAQGLLRLGTYLRSHSAAEEAITKYTQAGLVILKTLLDEPYLSLSRDHQGLLLHSVYHRPRAWDHVPADSCVPRGESSMWGDYHLAEVGILANRLRQGTMHSFYRPAV